ncbi:uncharacterized protein [Cherax quadricarinatus]|uniref:uncharacterized protein isoform X2 n=1 Tax=Cherax quadricarinatus TaxID=27406 RepID=UPI00387EBAFD
MGSSVATQFRCSCWRHYLAYLRHWPWVLGSVLLAVAPFILLASLKTTAPPYHQHVCHFRSRALWSGSPLAAIQSFVCNLPNTCYQEGQDDLLDHYPGAPINALLNSSLRWDDTGGGGIVGLMTDLPTSLDRLTQVADILTNPNLTTLMEKGLQVRDIIKSPDYLAQELTSIHHLDPGVVSALLEAKINVSRVMSLVGYRNVKEVVCSPEQLSQFLVTLVRSQVDNISMSLCDLPINQAANISQVFVDSLDPGPLFDKVSEVLEAIGGYEAEHLVRQVGALLASLGRLEALAPLTTTLNTLSSALKPLISALNTLTASAWDFNSLSKLMRIAESLSTASTLSSSSRSGNTSALHTARSVSLLISPQNVFTVAAEEELNDPWVAMLQAMGLTLGSVGEGIGWAAEVMQQNPSSHTLLTLSSTLLPTLLQPMLLTPDRLGEALDNATARMLPEVGKPITHMLTALYPTILVATNLTQASNIMLSWMVSEPRLPMNFSPILIITHSNFFHMQKSITEERLGAWACDRTSWPGVSDDYWLVVQAKFCSEAGARDLQQITALLKTPLNNQSLVVEQILSDGPVSASQVIQSLIRLWEVIQSSANLLNRLELDHALNSSEGTSKRRKRSILDEVSSLVSELPPGTQDNIEAFQNEAQLFKYIIQNLTMLYLSLTRDALLGAEDLQEAGYHLPVLYTLFNSTTSVETIAKVTSSAVESLVYLVIVFQQPWHLSDLILNKNFKSLLSMLPANMLEVTENVFNMMEKPKLLKVPAPLPQLVEVLNASYNALSTVISTGDPWVWCVGGCPHTISVLHSAALVLPRLLALPYLMSVCGLTLHMNLVQMLNETSWHYYPCGNATLVDLFPPASAVADLPASWSNLETIKEEVQGFEQYLCHNMTAIIDELTSDAEMTRTIKALAEDFTPGEVELGATLQLMRSFVQLLTSLNPHEILNNITTPQGTPILQEFQDAFTQTESIDPQVFVSMVLELVDQGVEWMGGDAHTQLVAHTVQYIMYHAHDIVTALANLLQDEVTLTSVLGLPEDYQLLQVFHQGPTGTANFILQEMLDLVTTKFLNVQEAWAAWGERVCNQSVGVSMVVEAVCYYTINPHPPLHFQSNFSSAVARALTEYQKSEIQVPHIGARELYEQCEVLLGQLQKSDFTKSINVSGLEHLWNSTVNESQILLAGLADLQKQWQWLVVDAVLSQSEDLWKILSKFYTLMSWYHNRLPVNSGNLTETIPPYIVRLHNVINSTWIDLLDGLDHSFHLNVSLFNLTLPEFCSSVSSLEEMSGNNSQFQEAVSELCNLLPELTPANLNLWLQYEQLIIDLENNTLEFSSSKLMSLVSVVQNQTCNVLQAFLTHKEADQMFFCDWSSASFSLPLPSYLLEENWNILLGRISERHTDNILGSVVPAVTMVLQWLGVEQNQLSDFLKLFSIQMSVLKSFLARNLQELLKDSPALLQLAETVTQYLPPALKDIISMVSNKPQLVGELLPSLQKSENWSSVCDFDFQPVGDDFHIFMMRLCHVNPQELLQDLEALVKLDILQSNESITIEEVMNSSILTSTQLTEQVKDGYLIQMFSKPLEYLGAENWTLLSSMVFNVTAEEMWDNSTMIVATLLEPLVELSRESTDRGAAVKTALQSLDKYLRWGRFLLALSRGGDIWMGIKEAYIDKPLVSQFLDMVQNLPEFVLEYITFFGNFSMMPQDMLLYQDTPCNFHLFLIDGHRDLLADNASSILTEVLEYVCEQHQMDLFISQLLPDSLPVIANVSMDVDAATLALLIDYIAWDFVYIIQGNYFEGDLQAPPWMDTNKWEKVLLELKSLSFLNWPVKEVLTIATGFGLDTVRMYQGDHYIVPAAGLVYNLAFHLAESINGSTGVLDIDMLLNGLGTVEALYSLVAPRISNLVALILWFPESEMYYNLASGMSPSVAYDEMCQIGVDKSLLHPNLHAEDWKALQELLCSVQFQTLYEDVKPLFNTSHIMTGVTINWMKIYFSLDHLTEKLKILNLQQFEKPFINNPFLIELRNLSTLQKFLRGVFIGISAIQQWSLRNDDPSYKHIFAKILIRVTAALTPITKDGVSSLYERLLDPQLFKELLKNYSHIVEDIHRTEANMSLQLQLNRSSLLDEMEYDFFVAENSTNKSTYLLLLSELRTSILNLTKSVMPPNKTSEIAVTGDNFLTTVTSNLVQNVEEVLHVAKIPLCSYISPSEEMMVSLQPVAKWLALLYKHLQQWDNYVNLTCEVSQTDLTDVLVRLLQDFDWEDDIKQMKNEEANQTFSCEFIFEQCANISEQVKDLATHYLQDEEAVQHLSTCLVSATNSTAGLQFQGILTVAGDLFGLESSKNISYVLSDAIASLPGISLALRTLGSRVAVMIPFENILIDNYETTLNFSTMVIDAIKNDLLVDVNRIYGADSQRLTSLLSSLENMKKWLRVRNKTEATNNIFKRSAQVTPIEMLYQVIQDMGQEYFTRNLIGNLNYTYLNTEIETIRMQALLSSNWVNPVMIHMNTAVASLSELSKLGAVMDLNKIITGEVDPVTFLTGSVQLLQMKLWTNLALSFSGILGEAVPVITGSELGDDLQRVVDGINTLQAARNLGVVDFTIPTISIISNWTDMQKYLEDVLLMDPQVIEALKDSQLNLMALLSLEDVTLEEVICGESQVERVITLPPDTQVTSAILTAYICKSNDSQGLAATFLQHLDLAPLIVILTKCGLNSSLSSHGMTLEQVMDAVDTLVEASTYLPTLTTSFSALYDFMEVFKEPQMSNNIAKNNTLAILKGISSPDFLERAGHALCGHPLQLVPDSLGLIKKHKEDIHEQNHNNKNVCGALYDNIKSLPGGGVLLHFIKPLMVGKIFYTPDNNITQGIIAQANETFEMVEKQLDALKQLHRSTTQLLTASTRDLDLQKLQESLEKSWVQGFMQQLLPASSVTSLPQQIKQASPQLQDAMKFAKEFSYIVEVGVNLTSCMELQRFMPVSNEEQLLKKAKYTAKHKEFLAGIVFAGVGETGDTGGNLPQNLTFTIRVDSEKSPSTLYLEPRFWSPGPNTNMALDMKYHQGFLQLQEVVENAIIKFQYKHGNDVRNIGAASLKNSNSYFWSVVGNASRNTMEISVPNSYKSQSSGVNKLPKKIESLALESRRTKREASAPLTKDEEKILLSLPVYTKQQPYPCYDKDDFTNMLNLSPMMSSLFSLMAFTIFVVFLIFQLVQEKESRNRQLQEVMGLRLWLDRLVWLFYSLLLLLLITLLVTLIDKFGGLQPNVNFGVLFAFLFCYGLSIISFCYMVSCLVPSTVLAVFIGVMSLLVFNVPYISISIIEAKTPFTIIILSCLLPSSAFGFGFRVICQFELLQKSVTYNNLWLEPVRGSDLTLGLAITMLLVDSAIFLILAVSISSLKKDPPQHLSTSGRSDLNPLPTFSEQTSLKQSNEFTFNIFQEDAVHVLDIDPGVKQSLKKGLSIIGLRRIFESRGRSKVAVDNLNLELYEGQVLVLLGHNGAGKTTVISMLTRELKPTAGTIKVYGHDIHHAWDKARRVMGLCPQQSVLFPYLTVQEVLRYYAILKDFATEAPRTDVNTVLLKMKLFSHRDYLVNQLSEGIQRRVCMAIAFIGNSKLVILDEPTAGIDPAARNAIWEIISDNRAGRTILLTTHHLDEAETLADRVAIMNQGRLLCVGSPLSLKSEYGLGYTLTLSNRSHYEEIPIKKMIHQSLLSANLEDKLLPPTDVIFSVGRYDDMWELIKSHVPNARVLETINGEVTYTLPLCDTQGNDNRLPEMFDELEKRMDELGFASLEIHPTSLEDVVIALNATSSNVPHVLQTRSKSRMKPMPEDEILPGKENIKNAFNFKPEETQQGVRLGMQRFSALILKRLLHHGRDWRFYVQTLVLPLLFIVLAMIGSKCRPTYKNLPPLTLDPAMYAPPTSTFIRTLDPALKPVAEAFLQLSIGKRVSTKNWFTCPSYVDTNPRFSPCNISSMAASSLCKCDDGRCIADVSNQPRLYDWLLRTRWQYIQNSGSRYGGISLGVQDPRLSSNWSGAMVWYDDFGYHALPAYVNMLNNARLQRLLGKNYSITTINKPIVFSNHGFASMSIQQHAADLGIGLLILVSLTVMCSATVGYATTERIRGERRVLYVAGITRRTYWTANMVWDVMVLLITVLLIAILLVIFNEQMFIWRENLAAFIILCLLYGLSILPLFYLMEGWFKTEAAAVFFFFCATFGIGLVASLLVVICQVMVWIKILEDIAGVLKYICLIFPPFSFVIGIKDMAVSFTKASIMSHFDMDIYMSPFSWDTKMQGGLGLHYLSLALWMIVGTVVLLCWHECSRAVPQSAAPTKNLAGAEEDKDVAAERIKIQCGGTSLYDTVLRLVGLGRDFTSPPTTAVSNLFLALRRGECFSLLGLNGAGKTTTFRCLTGDLRPTRGQILVNGLILEEALALPYPIMGYCPQSHALDPNLTAREALFIMALIRGFRSSDITPVLDRAIKELGLSEEEKTYIHQLSGGTKRKVSTAMTLLGNPLLVLLDEPTTGMDPASRRLVWRAIRSVTSEGRTVLLTSHSMDEIDQLSHRMAIMVNGQFVCIGSPHYLKYKLGERYTIRLKTKDIEDMECVLDFLRSQLADVILKEQHHLTVVAEVSRCLPLRLIFDSLNAAKSMGVTEYDVSQTTLNEVFRVLTSQQGDGQVAPPPITSSQEEVILPMHLSSLHPVDIKDQSSNITFQPLGFMSHQSMTPLDGEYDQISNVRRSLYDNVESDNREIYATVGKLGDKRKPSPDLDQENESGSSDDSPEEEWTHL